MKEKRIMNGEDITILREIDGYSLTIQLIKSFNNKKQIITFSMWDDFCFEGYINNIDEMKVAKKLEILIDKKDELYESFSKLLAEDKELVIDDDDILEENIRTMKIIKNEEGMNIIFNNREEKPEVMSKFKIFIKNIMEDGRSKLAKSDNNIKERLVNFFNDISEVFLEKEYKKEI